MKDNTITSNFQQAVIEAGITPPQRVEIDGHFHRFPTNGKTGDTAGWYVLNDLGTIVAGVFGCWRSGVTSKWSSINEETLDKQQLHRVHVEIKKAKKLADQKKMELQQKASINAEQAWSKAKDADSNHPYLVRKGVKAYGIKQFHFDGCQCLMIPLMDTEGKLWSYQRIYPDNRVLDKIFLKNGRVTGLFHTIGEPTPTRIIAEGYATAACLHESTGHCVHVAFNSHNLQQVAESIREAHSDVELIIAADDDWKAEGNPGLTYATKAAQASGAKLSIPTWPVNSRGEKDTDFNDLCLIEGPQAVKTCIDRAQQPLKAENEDGKKKSDKIKNGNDDNLSLATQLVQLVEQTCELFVDQNGESHARIEVESHHEVYRIESKLFREWLSQTFWDNEHVVVTDTTMKAALAAIAGIAKFTGDQRRVFLRIAAMENGQIFLDLANESWSCVEILNNGWSIRSDPPVMFVRTPNMRPLPEPSRSGDLDKLWTYVNVAEEDRHLLLAFLIECFRRQSPDPLLELTGLQGAAKSDSHRAIRKLIDPNRADLRSAPSKLDDDLLVPAANSLFVCFDNLSKLSDSMQDRLCSLSTGAGIASRKFYTNGEEFALDIQRPVIINGIIPMVTRPDLLDRTIAFEMPPLAERMAKTEIENAYEKDWPDMLGGLLDLLSVVLKLLPDIKISPRKLPRMADFAICGEAVYKVRGRETGEFLKDYAANRLKSNQRSLDASSVGIALISYREQFPVNFEGVLFTGTMKKLLSKLEPHRPDGEIWIKSPKGLSNALRRLIPVLRMNGIRVDIDNKAKKDGYHVHIRSIKTDME